MTLHPSNRHKTTWLFHQKSSWLVLMILPMLVVSQPCDFTVTPNAENIIILGPSFLGETPAPGTKICLQSGEYQRFLIRNLHGTEENPLIITNSNGQAIINNSAQYGIAFYNSSHIQLLGNGSPQLPYGIKISQAGGNGISVDQQSTNIEIGYMEISNTAMSGIMIKTDPSCDNLSAVRDSFELKGTKVHNNFIHNTVNEALYIGSSFYNGWNMTCNGTDTIVLPHLNLGVEVFNNIIEHTGRNAIQINSSPEGCLIYNNTIYNDSQQEIGFHMNGIQVGGGSRCQVFNNIIKDGKGNGINYFGFGPADIYNNVIVNPGRNYLPSQPANQNPVSGIFVRNVYTPTSAPVNIYHNTIINPKTTGVHFTNQAMLYPKIQNNIIINPGGKEFIGNRAYVQVSPQEHPSMVSHNYMSQNCKEALFSDTLQYNFSLQQGSPLINQGLIIDAEPLFFDILGQSRPIGRSSDPGAYENQASRNKSNSGFLFRIEVYPNPAIDSITLSLPFMEEQIKQLRIFDAFGKLKLSTTLNAHLYNQLLSVADFSPGIYHIIATTTSGYATNTFVKL